MEGHALRPWEEGRVKELATAITCVSDPRMLVVTFRIPNCVVPTCGAPLPKGRRRFCSDACATWWNENHNWNSAVSRAIRTNRDTNTVKKHITVEYWNGTKHEYDRDIDCCSRCKEPSEGYDTDRERLAHRLEVDHIIPINGGIRNYTCANHQNNLRVVCHRCHLEVTKEQRAAGLIGKKR